jgi:hypothetical protein
MTKKLKLKVKIKGDKTFYDLTEFIEGDSICCYDKRTGAHMDFNWDMVEGFVSMNPDLTKQKGSFIKTANQKKHAERIFKIISQQPKP